MMGIKLQLILIACTVTFGSTSIQPHNQAFSGRVNDESEIQEDFQNFFNSMTKNDTEKSGIYREILKREVARERQAFGAIEDELWTVRNRNAYKRRNFYRTNGISENFLAAKRETHENSGGNGTIICPTRTQLLLVTLEQSPGPDDFCSKLKANMRDHSVEGFIKTVNEQWRVDLASSEAELATNEACSKRLNQLFVQCGIPTEMQTKLEEPFGKDKRPVGVFDVCTKEQKDANVVVKLRYKKRSCVAFSQLLKCLQTPTVNEIYPQEKVMALALTVGSREESPIEDWIALFYQDGKIVGSKLPKPINDTCLCAKEFSQLEFRETPAIQLFEGWEAL